VFVAGILLIALHELGVAQGKRVVPAAAIPASD